MHFLTVCSMLPGPLLFFSVLWLLRILLYPTWDLQGRETVQLPGQLNHLVWRITCNFLPDGKGDMLMCKVPASNLGKLDVMPGSLTFPLCSPWQMQLLHSFKRAMLFICIKGMKGGKRDQGRKQRWTNFSSVWTTLCSGSEIARFLSNPIRPRKMA